MCRLLVAINVVCLSKAEDKSTSQQKMRGILCVQPERYSPSFPIIPNTFGGTMQTNVLIYRLEQTTETNVLSRGTYTPDITITKHYLIVHILGNCGQ